MESTQIVAILTFRFKVSISHKWKNKNGYFKEEKAEKYEQWFACDTGTYAQTNTVSP